MLAGLPQGSILWARTFSHDFSNALLSDKNVFAVDTSLFSLIYDDQFRNSVELNSDLLIISE